MAKPHEYNIKALGLALRHYRNEIKRNWRVALPAFLFPGLGNILVFYAPPLIVARLLTRFGGRGNFALEEFTPYVLLFGAVWLGGEIVWRIGGFFVAKLEAQGIRQLYIQGIDLLLAKDLAFFHDNFAGSLTKKTVGYAKSFEGFSDTLAYAVFANLIPTGFIAVILWKISPVLVFTLFGMVLLTILVIIPLIRRRQKLVIDRETASNIAAGHVADTLANMDAVRAFSREDFEKDIHMRNVTDYTAKARRSWNYQNLKINSVISPLYVFTNMAGLMVAAYINRGGVFSAEAIFVTFSYFAGFTRIMWEFNQIYRNLENNLTEAAQFTELLLEPPKINDPERPRTLQPNGYGITFRSVSFSYHEKGKEHLFENFSFSIRPGEKIGLVGRSGGGKTTITKLLLRLMDIRSGAILIDGESIGDIAQKDLRNIIAYVPQDPIMFHRTIMENIRYGRLEASDDEIYKISNLAHAAEFIERLPQGYHTFIGERGVKLSGGQRQRVAIARAMLKNAPILVLDEATSSLDSESEKLIQDALWKLMEGRTAIVIAHRLSTVQKMDRLIVLDNGKIIEEGTHHKLLKNDGIYAHLWAHQSGGFLEV